MNIVPHLQEIDDLVVEHTKPPITTILRNKLAFCIEQAQAHSSAVERQEQTLSRQIETIERLMEENQKLIAVVTKLETHYEPPSIEIIDQNPEATYKPESR